MHQHCSRCPIWSLTVWFIQYPISGCLGQSSKIFRKYQKYLKYLGNIRNIKNIFGNILWQYFWRCQPALDPRFATDVYLVDSEQKEEAVEKMRRYFVNRNLNVHTRWTQTIQYLYICMVFVSGTNIFVSEENIFWSGKMYLYWGKIYFSQVQIYLSQGEIYLSQW